MALSCVVVVPARDEARRIGACLHALAEQTLPRDWFETIVVIDACQDDTEAVVRAAAAALQLPVSTVPGPGRGPGAARRAGMDLATARLMAINRPDGLIACTDADSRPAADWLERQLAHVRLGVSVIAGLIELDPEELGRLPDEVVARRERDAVARLRRVRAVDPDARHHHFAGASIGVTAAVYREVGGLEAVPALEDAAFAARLEDHHIPILRPTDVRVRTSARSDGRVARGLSVDLGVALWSERRRYEAGQFPPDRLAGAKAATSVTVIIPTKNCAATIEPIIRCTVSPLARLGLIDELVVVDAGSEDGTARIARDAGARVLQQDELVPARGLTLGKGDAMWRSLQATGGDVVCFLDGDTEDPQPSHLQGLLGPMLTKPAVALVKGSFDRPLHTGAEVLAHEGGRVTELMARPLLNLHEPRLAGFAQPLAGEFAARRELLEAIPFPVGYGVEIAVLIDALRLCGLDALAECHLGSRQNRHQPLRALGEMAYAVLAAVERRLGGGRSAISGSYLRPWDDGAVAAVPVIERPPINGVPQPRRAEDLLRPAG